tara:strand:+ start:799 stop:1434 length:636 start_codon:yes stop_codon:yes gene_type:complete
MAILTAWELIDLTILVIALGYIFSGFVKRPRDPLHRFTSSGFNLDDLKYAALVVSPAVVLHEIAHKGVGLFYGFDSILHISIFGLGIGVILRFIRSPIIFFIPAFVASSAALAQPAQFAILAFAGPAANFALYWISDWALLSRKWPKYNHAFIISRQINLWLMILNMIPFGLFDGAKILAGNPTLYIAAVAIGGFLVYQNEQKWKRYVLKF